MSLFLGQILHCPLLCVRLFNEHVLCCNEEELRSACKVIGSLQIVAGLFGICVEVFTLLVVKKVVTWKSVFGNLSEAGAFFLQLASSATVLKYLAHVGLGVTLLAGISSEASLILKIWMMGATAALVAGLVMMIGHVVLVTEHTDSAEESAIPITYLFIIVVVFGIYCIGTVETYRKKIDETDTGGRQTTISV